MNIFGWIYVILTVIGSYSNIMGIGKPRRAITNTDAAVSVVTSILMFMGLYYWGLR